MINWRICRLILQHSRLRLTVYHLQPKVQLVLPELRGIQAHRVFRGIQAHRVYKDCRETPELMETTGQLGLQVLKVQLVLPELRGIQAHRVYKDRREIPELQVLLGRMVL